MGLRVPEDISVVGFADDDFACEMSPPLTTIRQSGYETGRQAAKLLLARSQGPAGVGAAGPHRVRLPVELVDRKSVTTPQLSAGKN